MMARGEYTSRRPADEYDYYERDDGRTTGRHQSARGRDDVYGDYGAGDDEYGRSTGRTDAVRPARGQTDRSFAVRPAGASDPRGGQTGRTAAVGVPQGTGRRNAIRPQQQGDDPNVVLPGGKESERSFRFWREVIETIVLTALVFFAVKAAIEPTRVSGPSMQPTLYTSEWVMVNKMAYLFNAPGRGDVIVLHPPIDPHALFRGYSSSDEFVKRIIAIPGDTISVTTDNKVIVDGKTLNEPYIPPSPNDGVVASPAVIDKLKLGKDEYFVMGDNRWDSTDSRSFGIVPRQNIIGRAEFVMWPPSKAHGIPTYPDVFSGIKQ